MRADYIQNYLVITLANRSGITHSRYIIVVKLIQFLIPAHSSRVYHGDLNILRKEVRSHSRQREGTAGEYFPESKAN